MALAGQQASGYCCYLQGASDPSAPGLQSDCSTRRLCLLPQQAQHFPTAGYLAAHQKEQGPIGTDFLNLLMTKL